jgi:excinuclease ABC subunit C
MLGEVVERSLSRRVREGEEAPDLLVVDGGGGQVSAALEALGRVGLETVPVIGLAKAKELVYVRGRKRPLALARDSLALRFLQRIRDEAHRFAISHHRRRRSSAQLKTILDGVAGLGPARRSTLIRKFGSAAAAAAAPESEIAALPGFGAVTARRVKDALRGAREGARDA